MPSKCINCEGDHLSISSICPLFIRQKNIHVLVSVENISRGKEFLEFLVHLSLRILWVTTLHSIWIIVASLRFRVKNFRILPLLLSVITSFLYWRTKRLCLHLIQRFERLIQKVTKETEILKHTPFAISEDQTLEKNHSPGKSLLTISLLRIPQNKDKISITSSFERKISFHLRYIFFKMKYNDLEHTKQDQQSVNN